MYLDDYNLNATIDFKFTTRKSTGLPTQLAGSPAVSVYKTNSTTQTTTGVTLTVDFDSVTGLNHVRIDTSADGTFYAAGCDFAVVITAGTVDSISVVGETIATFSILNRSALRPTVAGRTFDVTATGAGGIDWGNIENATTTVAFTGTTIATTQQVDVNTIKTQTVTCSAGVTVSPYIGSTGAAVNGTNANTLASHDPGGTIASSTEVTAIQNNTRTVIVVPAVIERPDSGTDTYLIHIYLYDEVGNMEAPDSAPTVSLTNSAGTDRSSRLGSTTGTLVGTGHYKWVYTNTSTDTLEQLLWEFSVVEGGATRLFGRDTLLVDTTAVDFTSSDRTVLNAAATAVALASVATSASAAATSAASVDTKLTSTRAGYLDNLSGGAVATASALSSVSSALTTAAANVVTILGKFTGITLLAQWLGAMAGKQTPNSTALTEINATGAGSGTYSAITDSQEALRDNYTTGGDTLVVAPVVATVVGNNIVSSGTTQAFRYRPLPTGPITVVNSAGTAINLSSAAVTLRCVNTTDPTDTWTLTEATGLSVGGASNNEVSIDYVPTFYGKYKWWLDYQPSGETDWTLGGFGFFDIGDAPDPR